MSTRFTITVQRPDGTYSGVYGHFDGHLEGVGAELITSYNSKEDATMLVDHGEIRSIAGGLEFYGDYDLVVKGAESHQEVIEKIGQVYNYVWTNGAWYVEDGEGTYLVSSALDSEPVLLGSNTQSNDLYIVVVYTYEGYSSNLCCVKTIEDVESDQFREILADYDDDFKSVGEKVEVDDGCDYSIINQDDEAINWMRIAVRKIQCLGE